MYQLRLLWLWIFILLLISSCQQNLIQQERLVIDKGNVNKILEVSKLKTDHKKPVSAIVIPSGNNELPIALAGTEGIIQKWDILNQSLLKQTDAGPVSVIGTAFDAQGELLALTAGETELTRKQPGYSTDLSGLIVLSTETGEIVTEFGFGYGGVRRPTGDYLSSVALNAGGRWVGIGADGGAIIWDVQNKKAVLSLVSFVRASAVAFADDDKAVIAYENGNTELYQVTGQPPTTTRMDISDSLWISPEVPLAVALSPDENWLAHLGQSNLTFSNLEKLDTVAEEIVAEMEANGDLEKFETGADFFEAFHNALEEKKKLYAPSKPVPSGPAGALVFNPTGDLLAVGTIAGWQIWDVEQQELLVEHEAEGVYALTFSPDGRWFAWGDTGGVIHLWAVLR